MHGIVKMCDGGARGLLRHFATYIVTRAQKHNKGLTWWPYLFPLIQVVSGLGLDQLCQAQPIFDIPMPSAPKRLTP